MTYAEMFLPEFEQEMATTRRVLERVPDDKGRWKPHPKSFSLAHLAQLVSSMPGWIANTIGQDAIDLAASPGYSDEKTATLLGSFDAHVADARTALSQGRDGDDAQPWSLKFGDKVLMTMPKGAAVRQHLNHHVHHRAQLAMYLRLLDVPVPSMYGPTADEPWSATTSAPA
jgi:uncharacterized damage-inducible protein DinB